MQYDFFNENCSSLNGLSNTLSVCRCVTQFFFRSQRIQYSTTRQKQPFRARQESGVTASNFGVFVTKHLSAYLTLQFSHFLDKRLKVLKRTVSMPGSQSSFPSNPEHDQNNEDTSIISFITYYVYLPLSCNLLCLFATFLSHSILIFIVPIFSRKGPKILLDPVT